MFDMISLLARYIDVEISTLQIYLIVLWSNRVVNERIKSTHRRLDMKAQNAGLDR